MTAESTSTNCMVLTYVSGGLVLWICVCVCVCFVKKWHTSLLTERPHFCRTKEPYEAAIMLLHSVRLVIKEPHRERCWQPQSIYTETQYSTYVNVYHHYHTELDSIWCHCCGVSVCAISKPMHASMCADITQFMQVVHFQACNFWHTHAATWTSQWATFYWLLVECKMFIDVLCHTWSPEKNVFLRRAL